jgi:hypothetical protein
MHRSHDDHVLFAALSLLLSLLTSSSVEEKVLDETGLMPPKAPLEAELSAQTGLASGVGGGAAMPCDGHVGAGDSVFPGLGGGNVLLDGEEEGAEGGEGGGAEGVREGEENEIVNDDWEGRGHGEREGGKKKKKDKKKAKKKRDQEAREEQEEVLGDDEHAERGIDGLDKEEEKMRAGDGTHVGDGSMPNEKQPYNTDLATALLRVLDRLVSSIQVLDKSTLSPKSRL